MPVEVKVGNSRSKSLRELIDSVRYGEIRWGVKFADANIGWSRNVLTLPWFCAFLFFQMLKRYRSSSKLQEIMQTSDKNLTVSGE